MDVLVEITIQLGRTSPASESDRLQDSGGSRVVFFTPTLLLPPSSTIVSFSVAAAAIDAETAQLLLSSGKGAI